jgi:hypothetical protein
LIEHAPLGANMRLDATRQVIISEVTLETYAYLDASPSSPGPRQARAGPHGAL